MLTLLTPSRRKSASFGSWKNPRLACSTAPSQSSMTRFERLTVNGRVGYWYSPAPPPPPGMMMRVTDGSSSAACSGVVPGVKLQMIVGEGRGSGGGDNSLVINGVNQQELFVVRRDKGGDVQSESRHTGHHRKEKIGIPYSLFYLCKLQWHLSRRKKTLK